jgi:hypothetical protein
MKKIGMGSRQFFYSSNFFHKRFQESRLTGRLRIEESFKFKSKEEERAWLDAEPDSLV